MKKIIFTLLIILCSIQIVNSQTGWQWVNPYPQGNTLEQVQMLNSSTGYAVTTSNSVIKTINGGVNWSILSVNSSAQLFSVFFTDVNTGYVCGNNGSIYKTINGGTNWAALQSGTTLYMDQIYFVNANTGFVASDGAVLRTTNAGVNWTLQTLRGGYFYGPCFPNATTGYLCGQGSSSENVYKTTNMGANWTDISVGVNDNFYSIYFTDANTGYTAGSHGKVYKTINGGTNWDAGVSVNAPYYVSQLVFTNASTGYVCGQYNTVYITTNAGLTWSLKYSTVINTGLNSISFLKLLTVALHGII